MATFSRAKVTIYDSVIRGHFAEGGIVMLDTTKVARSAGGLAKGFAPVRTGKLKRSIQSIGKGSPGTYGSSFTTFANVRYGIFVEDGTLPFVHARGGHWMRIPRSIFGATSVPRAITNGRIVTDAKAHDREFYFKTVVRGQVGQHFIRRGVDGALARHGYGSIG